MWEPTEVRAPGEPASGDAYGRIVERCWAAGAVPGVSYEVVERDDGFIGVTDAYRYFQRRSEWPAEEIAACDMTSGRVLDVGCGPGRHAVALRDIRVEVTGLEPSPGAAAVARARGVRVIEQPIENLTVQSGSYDTFLLLGDNIGLLASREHAPAVLGRLAGVANPGARILATSRDPYAVTSAEHLAYHERNRAAGRLGGQLRIRVRDRQLATGWFDYLKLSADELGAVIEPTPWRLTEVCPGDGSGYLAVLSLG